MYRFELPDGITTFYTIFYRIGFWHRGDEPTRREKLFKILYFMYYSTFIISIVIGAIQSDNTAEKVLLVEYSMQCAVLALPLFKILWRKTEILEMLTRIGVYSTNNHEGFTYASEKIKLVMKFLTFYFYLVHTSGVLAGIEPFCLSERTMYIKLAFPLDWKNSFFGFVLANFFVYSQIFFTLNIFAFTIMLWFSLMTGQLRYRVLGHEIRNMGVVETSETTGKRNISDKEQQKLFRRDLVAAIDTHQRIREYWCFRCH